MNEVMSPRDQILGARSYMYQFQPFWGYIMGKAEVVVGDTSPTAWATYDATGGSVIGFNPEFLKTLTIFQTMAVMIHELRHVIGLHAHSSRVGSRDPYLWNIAADAVVNTDPWIRQYAPQGCVTIDKLDIPDKATFLEQAQSGSLVVEEVYAALLKNCKKPKDEGEEGETQDQKDDRTKGKQTGLKDYSRFRDLVKASLKEGEEEPSADSIRQRVREEIQKAISMAPGKTPTDIQNILKHLAPGQISWTTQIRDWTSSVLGLGRVRSYRRPPRIEAPWIQPGRARTEGKVVACLMDTSGSVPDEAIEHFFAELESIQKYATLWLIIFDTEATTPIIYKRGDWMRTKFPRGGTDVRVAFDKLKKLPHLDGCVILTDMYTPFPEGKQIPPYPCLWVSTTEHKAPFGRTIPLVVGHGK